MNRWLRWLLIAAGAGVAVLAIVLGLAWAFMPKEWISQEAQRQAARLTGAEVRWKSLEPGFDGLSLGVRLKGFAYRAPAKGDPQVDARAQEIFVRFKLLPLLFKRVEIAAARVRGAGIATWDRGPQPEPPGEPPGADGGMALTLPRLDLDGVDIRTRDLYGGGMDVRRLKGFTEISGTLDRPRAVRVEAEAESLFWKGSARDPLLPLPSPLTIDLALAAGATKGRLDVRRGDIGLGPLRSTMSGSITMAPAPEPMRLDLVVKGEPQELRSTDEALRAFAAASPAAWSTTAAWEIRIGGTAAAMTQAGNVTLKPVSVASGENKFTLDAIRANWTTSATRTYTARAQGGGSGLKLNLDAKGSLEPGGTASGTFELDAPATRLNGLAPNTPTWKSGAVAVRALFVTRAPSPPDVRWTMTGREMSGSAPGLERPIEKLSFQLAGDAEQVTVRALQAKVGSSTAKVTGTMKMGKPLGTGAFTAQIDRFVSEEWAPPKPAKGAAPAAKAAPAAPPALPFRNLTADVTIGELRQGTMTLRDVTVPIRYDGGTLQVSPIQGAIGTGTLSGALTVRDLVGKPSYALKLGIVKAPAHEVAGGLIPFDLGISGLLNGDVELSGPGLPGPEVSDSLRGSLSGTVEQGKIADTESLRKIRTALGIGAGAETAFRTISHVLRIERGRLLLDKVRGDLGADKFELTGALGLDKSLDLRLLLRLAPERVKGSGTLAQLANYARDSEGRIPVELSIGGTTKSPKVQLKSGKLLDVAGQGLKESLTKSLTKKLTPPGGATDTLGGRADSARADSAAAADPLRKSRDALRRLLGK
ncbi:MAG TPA: AsmA-like C-terminal region-containing protein [Acidobacteriota bacterium]|nr:AsmA-like C-terminal region-containing protein [Acidobacteriota bacterium]